MVCHWKTFAGVINLITKTAADIDGSEAGARVGSYRSRDVWLPHGGTIGDISVAAFMRWGKTDGQSERIDQDLQTLRDLASPAYPPASLAPGPQDNAVDALDATLDLGLGKWRLRGSYKQRDNMGVGVGSGSALDPDSFAKSVRAHADLSWTNLQLSDDLGAGVQASYLSWTEQYPNQLLVAPPGASVGTTVFPDGVIAAPNRWERSTRISGFLNYSGIRSHNLRLGAGHDDLDLYKATTTRISFFSCPAASRCPPGRCRIIPTPNR